MDHGKQVVRPVRELAPPMVAVGDEGERADLPAELGDALVRHIQDAHSVGGIADRGVMLTPLERVDRLAALIPPPSRHRHSYD